MRPIDDLDRALAERLRKDGREGTRSLALALDVSEASVSARLRRMEEESILRVVAITDLQIYGHRELAIVSVRTTGRPAFEVGAILAAIPETMAVTVATGQYDLIAPVLARNHAQFIELLAAIKRIPGVESIDCQLVISVHRYESGWGQLGTEMGTTPDAEPGDTVDDVDIQIIALLQQDARRSNRSIAAELGLAEGTVRARIRKMEEGNVIRIQAISDVEAFGVGAHAYVGIHCDRTSAATVAQRLQKIPSVSVLVQTLGSFDLFAVVNAADRAELVGSVIPRISATPGVRRTETMEGARTLKHVYTWGRLL